MNTSNKLLSVLAILTLSACQAGRVSSNKSTVSQIISANPSPTLGAIQVGNVPGGVNLQVEPTPTPAATPAPTTAPTVAPSSSIVHEAAFIFAQLISSIGTEAMATVAPTPTPSLPVVDAFMIRYQSDYIGQLQAVLGSEFLTIQNIYTNYAAMVAANLNPPVPAELQRVANLQFVAASSAIATLSVPLVNLLNPKYAVISRGNQAWGGFAFINPANNTVAGGSIESLAGAKVVQTGANTLKLVGGQFNGTIMNQNYVNITLSGQSFALTTSVTPLPASASYVALKPVVVNSAMVSAFGVSAITYQAKYIFLAKLNGASQIVGFLALRISDGVITTLSTTCNATRAAFFGHACYIGTTTAVTTFTN